MALGATAFKPTVAVPSARSAAPKNQNVYWRAAIDNPDLWVACIVGDGEAETGPLATGWHSNKL